MLIENKVEIDARTIYYETVLMVAARKGSMIDIWNDTSFFLISRNQSTISVCAGNEPITKLLIQNGANINAKDIFGDTALHGAVEGGSNSLIDFLSISGYFFNDYILTV